MLPNTGKAILAAVMDRDEYAHILFSNLTESDFEVPWDKIFRAMKSLYESKMDLDWATVRDAVEIDTPAIWADKLGTPAIWQEMRDMLVGLHYSGYEAFIRERVEKIRREGGRRKTLGGIVGILRRPNLEDEDIGEIEREVQKLRMVGAEREPCEIGGAFDDYYEAVKQEPSAIKLGIPSFDHRIGGFNLGEVVLIMARAAVGKTFLALNVMRHIATATPHKIAFFSLEMSRAAIAERILQLHFDLGRGAVWEMVRKGEMNDAEAREVLSRVSVYSKIYSVAEIKGIVEREKYKVVFIDFLHLIRSDVQGNAYQQVSAIMQGIKQAAKDTNAVFFPLHQLSRQAGSGGTPVAIDHARDSGLVEEMSDFIVGAWAPELDTSLKAEARAEWRNCLSLGLLKNKRGERWLVKAHFDKVSGRIHEIDEREVGSGRTNENPAKGDW